MKDHRLARALVVGIAIAAGFALVRADSSGPVLPGLSPTPTFAVSTVPANGDVNPYGVAFVPSGFPAGGLIAPGDVLVSNFNNGANLQGTGTTIVSIDSNGQQRLFFQGHGLLGLTTALGVLQGGFVLVGSLPTTTPSATCTGHPSGQQTGVNQGALLILDRQARVVTTLRSRQFLDGPWDLTVHDNGATAQVFVSNALTATVTRVDLAIDGTKGQVSVTNTTQIASGFTRRCDPAALVIGPTGLAYDAGHDVLYVASTGDNAIYAVSNASTATGDQGTGSVAVTDNLHLHGPLGLVLAPNGDLITSQGDAVNPDPNQPSEIVEYSPTGQFIAEFSVDSAPGSAFGMALEPLEGGFRFAAVDDGTNELDIWVVQ
jgi:hypothetical protein